MDSPIQPGGALDASNPKDQALIRNAARQWPKRFASITEDRKARWVAGLDKASNVGENMAESDDPDTAERGALLLISTAKTGALFESLNQRDEHHAEDTARENALAGMQMAQAMANLTAEQRQALVEEARRSGLLPAVPEVK